MDISEKNKQPSGTQTAEESGNLIDELIAESIPANQRNDRSGNRENLVGECLDTRHPTLLGRVLVKWTDSRGDTQEKWLPALQNLPVRVADRVLMVKPANWNEMVVVGVIDGFAARPEKPRGTAAALELPRDRSVRVIGSDGQELMELFQADSGPVVRLLHKDANVELPGKLSLKADSIELEAGAGPITIKASDDVCINGEMVHLN